MTRSAYDFLSASAQWQSLLGSIYYGALGDAMGSHYEGQESPKLSDSLQLFDLTDDTQLTLATLNAIANKQKVDGESIAKEMANWHDRRLISLMGASTYKALQELSAGMNWLSAGRSGQFAAGNGAAMRIAPCAFFIDVNDFYDRRTLEEISGITHKNSEAYAGALAVCAAIQHQKNQATVEELLSNVAKVLPDTQVRDRIQLLANEQHNSIRFVAKEFGCSSYVVESVPLSLFAASKATNHQQAIDTLNELVRCGGDTDTNASICGQVIGARITFRSLPQNVFSDLAEIDHQNLLIRTTYNFVRSFGPTEPLDR